MEIKINKWNKIFGYGYFIIGALKIITFIWVVMQAMSALGGESANITVSSFFTLALGFVEFILLICGVIMIIQNKKDKPEIISGYALGIGATLIGFILPSFAFLAFFSLFIQCSMYMKAGTKIIKCIEGTNTNYKDKKQILKETEWFYVDNNK